MKQVSHQSTYAVTHCYQLIIERTATCYKGGYEITRCRIVNRYPVLNRKRNKLLRIYTCIPPNIQCTCTLKTWRKYIHMYIIIS